MNICEFGVSKITSGFVFLSPYIYIYIDTCRMRMVREMHTHDWRNGTHSHSHTAYGRSQFPLSKSIGMMVVTNQDVN